MKIFLYCLILLTLLSCSKNEEIRTYTEKVKNKTNSSSTNTPIAPNDRSRQGFQWKTPADWQENPGGGMRTVNFTHKSLQGLEAYILFLGMQSGSMEENVDRWAKQLDVTLSKEELEKFISSSETIKSVGNLSISIFDFGTLVKESKSKSMVAAIFSVPNRTGFVKLTGTKEQTVQVLKDFKQLCQSFSINKEIPKPTNSTPSMSGDVPSNEKYNKGVTWKTPSEWIEKAGEGMRTVTFTHKKYSSLETFLLFLGKESGTLEANAERWAHQLKLVLSVDQLKKFIKESPVIRTKTNEPMTILKFSSLVKNNSDPSMTGAVVILPASTAYIKMSGTKEDVLRAEKEFESFCKTLSFDKEEEKKIPIKVPSQPTATPPMSMQQGEVPQNDTRKKGFSWVTPQGWSELAGSGMRTVTFKHSQYPSAECYILFLGLQSGTVEQNADRWARQFGVNFSASELSSFVNKQKKFQSTGNLAVTLFDYLPYIKDDNSSAMLGAIVDLPQRKAYVKLTGTKGELEKLSQGFTSLCQSFQLNQ